MEEQQVIRELEGSILKEWMEGSSFNALRDKYKIANNYHIRKIIPLGIKTIRDLLEEEGIYYCVKCHTYKKEEFFHLCRGKRKSTCATCRRVTEPYNKEYQLTYNSKPENKIRKSKVSKEYRIKNKEKIREYKKSKHYKDIKQKSDKKYYQRIIKTPKLKLNSRIKSAMSESIKYTKSNKYFEIVGYTIEDLQKHLETLFKEGMSWENYGRGGWHVDHIRPLASFDLTKEREFKEAWSLNNLQPLWESDNCSKGSLYNGVRHREYTEKYPHKSKGVTVKAPRNNLNIF